MSQMSQTYLPGLLVSSKNNSHSKSVTNGYDSRRNITDTYPLQADENRYSRRDVGSTSSTSTYPGPTASTPTATSFSSTFITAHPPSSEEDLFKDEDYLIPMTSPYLENSYSIINATAPDENSNVRMPKQKPRVAVDTRYQGGVQSHGSRVGANQASGFQPTTIPVLGIAIESPLQLLIARVIGIGIGTGLINTIISLALPLFIPEVRMTVEEE